MLWQIIHNAAADRQNLRKCKLQQTVPATDFNKKAPTVDVVSLEDSNKHEQSEGRQREVVLHRLHVVDRGSEVLPSVVEERVRHLLDEHAHDGEHRHACMLHLTLAEFLHIDCTELFCVQVNSQEK